MRTRPLVLSLLLLGVPAAYGEDASGEAPRPGRSTRIDFDDRLIQGQTNRAGAVHLYDRKELSTPSLIKTPTRFRLRIESESHEG